MLLHKISYTTHFVVSQTDKTFSVGPLSWSKHKATYYGFTTNKTALPAKSSFLTSDKMCRCLNKSTNFHNKAAVRITNIN